MISWSQVTLQLTNVPPPQRAAAVEHHHASALVSISTPQPFYEGNLHNIMLKDGPHEIGAARVATQNAKANISQSMLPHCS
jgi:hypothetical protein